MKNKLILAALSSLIVLQFASAQVATTTTANGDVLCVLTNGSSVPCEIVADAEQSIALGGKSINPTTGETFCPYKDRVVKCTDLNQDGSLKANSFQEYFLSAVVWVYEHKAVIASIVLILLVLLVYNIYHRRKIRAGIDTNMIVVLGLLAAISMITFQKPVLADTPVYSGVECRCVSSAAQTCATSPIVDFNWLTIGPGTSLSSCDAANSYTTFRWPNTPPQFFYLGIETVIGDIASGNKNEAKGVSTSQNLSATTIGQDTGVSCVRSGGVPNMTLKLTGKLNYTVQGICFIGVCQYYSKISQNYSCY